MSTEKKKVAPNPEAVPEKPNPEAVPEKPNPEAVPEKKVNPKANAVFQCLDYDRPAQIVVLQKKANDFKDRDAVTKVVEVNASNQYVIDGKDDFKDEMIAGIEDAIDDKGLKVVRLDTLKEGEVLKVLNSLKPETETEKLQRITRERDEAKQDLEKAQAKIAELEIR